MWHQYIWRSSLEAIPDTNMKTFDMSLRSIKRIGASTGKPCKSCFFASTISRIYFISMLRSLWASSLFLAISSSFSAHPSFVFSSRISSRRAALFRVDSVDSFGFAAISGISHRGQDGRCFSIADIFSLCQAHSTCSVDGRSVLGSGAPGCRWQGLRLAARIVGALFWKQYNSENCTKSFSTPKTLTRKIGQLQ